MKYYIDCEEGCRVKTSSLDTIVGRMMDVPKGFKPEVQMDYRMVNGKLVHDPLPPEKTMPTELERIAAIEKYLLEKILGEV